MKSVKFIICLFLSLFAYETSLSAELTTEQKRFRSSIESFLKEEGFFPTIDNEDNSLNFKKEGTLYWISVGDSNPFYLEFHIAGFSCEDADKNLVLQAVNAANRKVRCAKAMFKDTSVAFAIEMYSHSSEEFRYVFYKCLKELSNIKEEVSDYYNNGENNNSTSSTPSNAYGRSSAIDTFFPVYGFTIGKVSVNDMKAKGHTVKKGSSGVNQYCDIRGVTFWDFDQDDVFEEIYMVKSDKMPEKWEDEIGLNWRLSYNQLISKFQSMGYSITIDKSPQTVEYQGRKTLSAEITATSPDGRLSFNFDFDYGNEKGEGYSTNSPNSIWGMTIEAQ